MLFTGLFFVLIWVFFVMDFGVVGQKADAEDNSFQGASKGEHQLLLQGSMGEKPVSEGAVNPGDFPCVVIKHTASKGKNFHLFLFWVQNDSLAKDLVILCKLVIFPSLWAYTSGLLFLPFFLLHSAPWASLTVCENQWVGSCKEGGLNDMFSHLWRDEAKHVSGSRIFLELFVYFQITSLM